MTTPAPNLDNETPSTHAPFITPPFSRTSTHVPEVTQSQTDKNHVSSVDFKTPIDDHDGYAF